MTPHHDIFDIFAGVDRNIDARAVGAFVSGENHGMAFTAISEFDVIETNVLSHKYFPSLDGGPNLPLHGESGPESVAREEPCVSGPRASSSQGAA